MQIKNRQKLLAILALGLVGLFAADSLLLTPLTHLWKRRAERIETLRKQVKSGQELIAREQNIRQRWTRMNTNALPDNNSLAEQQVLKAFDTWSQDSRISVLGITPQWRRDMDDYRTLQCRVEASGNLFTVSRFLYEIEKDPLGFRIESLELAAKDAEGQQFALGMQLSGLVLTLPEAKR